MKHAALICSRSYAALEPHVAEFLRAAAGSPETLLLAPARGAADDLVRRVCPAGAFGVHRMTATQLAVELAVPGLAAEGLAPASRLAIEAICARISHQLRLEGAIPYFAPVAGAAGFARALSATLTELRLNRIGPETIALEGKPGRDLSALLELYNSKLNETGLADLAAILRLAAAEVAERKHRFANASLILLDLPIESALARDFLSTLCSGAPRVLAVTMTGDEPAIADLERILGISAMQVDAPAAATQLGRMRDALFAPQPPEPAADDESLDYFSAPGEGMECVEIARRIRKLGESSIPFDRVAILLRDPERYQLFAEEALRRAGIPGYFTRGVMRPHPAGRAFLALLACARDGCSATRFAEYLSLGQVPTPGVALDASAVDFPEGDELLAAFLAPPPEREPEPAPPDNADEQSPVIGGALQSPAGWEDLLVDAAVIGGVDRWERRLRGLEAELKARRSELKEDGPARARLDDEIARLENLERFAIPIVRQLNALPARAIWRDWLDILAKLARSALREREPVLAVLSELTAMGEVGPITLDEAAESLSERLRFLRRESGPRRFGSVFIASIAEARGRNFEAVFLPGLAEGLFPRKVMEDPLLLDTWRPAPLPRQDDRVRQERLLLRRAVAAASERFIFSYPRVDVAQSRARVPSLYALEIVRAAQGKLPELRDFEERAAAGAKARLDWPAPPTHADAIDDAEYDLVSLDRAIKDKKRGGVRYLVEINQALGRSLRGRAWRWKSKWTYADGLVDPDENARAALSRHALDARSYSASALQQFAQCPYRFLLQAIHQLRPRQTPVALEQMDPLTRGALFHAVQRDLLSALRSSDLLPVSRERLNRIRDLADATLDRVAAAYSEDLAPAIPRVWKSEVEEIRADMHGWLGTIATAGDGWIPIHFELGFGLGSDPGRDPASRAEEVVLENGARLRGSIDLVERHEIRNTLRIVDHKTGRVPDREPVYVGGGSALQPLLYALAAEATLGAPVEASDLFYCTQRGSYQRIETAATPAARRFLARTLEIIGSSIADGFLPAAPAQDACAMCDYRAVCGPHEAQRVKRKNPEPLDSLVELRNMP